MNKLVKICFALSLVLMTTHCNSREGFYSNVLRSDVFVQAYSENKYDFLFVFDTSGSFKDRRDYVKDNMQTFLTILNSRKAVDYQIAVTTVDMFGGVAPVLPDSKGVRGNLVASSSGLKVVKSSSVNPAADFAGIMLNIEQSDTAFWEQGLEAAYQAVFQHGSEFSRPGVPLIIVFMSDSDDWSCKENCWGPQPENNTNYVPHTVARYTDYFSTLKKNEDSDVIIFPIVGLPAATCEVEFAGSRYIALQESLGGLSKSSSVCNVDLPSSFNSVARVIGDRGNVFKLSRSASGTGFSVYVNQELVPFSPENYVFEQSTNSIVFTGIAPTKGATVEVIYSEKTN